MPVFTKWSPEYSQSSAAVAHVHIGQARVVDGMAVILKGGMAPLQGEFALHGAGQSNTATKRSPFELDSGIRDNGARENAGEDVARCAVR